MTEKIMADIFKEMAIDNIIYQTVIMNKHSEWIKREIGSLLSNSNKAKDLGIERIKEISIEATNLIIK